jgi:hypothetical protein
VVTIGQENCAKVRQTGASMKGASTPHEHWRLANSGKVWQSLPNTPEMPYDGAHECRLVSLDTNPAHVFVAPVWMVRRIFGCGGKPSQGKAA